MQQSADTAERERKDQADLETATLQNGPSSKADKPADLGNLSGIDVKRMDKQQRGTLVDAVLQVDIACTNAAIFHVIARCQVATAADDEVTRM